MAATKLLCQSCFILFFVLEFTVATQSKPKENNPLVKREDWTYDCETERSSDYYGIGVRLGFYFQWLSAWIANVAIPGEIAGAQDANAMFLFATLIAMVRCAVTKLLLQVDGVILMHMCGGTLFGVMSTWGYRTCHYHLDGPAGIKHFGGFGTHMRLLLYVAISAFGLYFWLYGMTGALPTGEGPCEPVYTFMFASVRADGGIRIFYIFVCIACLIYFGVMLLASTIAGFSRTKKIFHLGKTGQWHESSRLKFATGFNMKQLRFLFYSFRILNLIWIIFTMIMIEFTLNYNHVHSVLGWQGHIAFPAQVIPMLIGAFSFVRIIWIRYEEWRSPDDAEPSLGKEPSFHPQTTMSPPHGLAWLKVFTPIQKNSVDPLLVHENDEVDPIMVDRPAWQRYLVAWLPWLALTRWIHQGGETLPTTEKQKSSDEPLRFSSKLPEQRRDRKRHTWGSDTTMNGHNDEREHTVQKSYLP